jgi:hypothetical protein
MAGSKKCKQTLRTFSKLMNRYTLTERRLIQQIRNKLKQNNGQVAKADKGNTIVIIYHCDYNNKI